MKHLKKYNEAQIQREKIDLSNNFTEKELERLLREEDCIEGYTGVQINQTYFDNEKGYNEYDIIIKRISDGVFFKGSGQKWGGGYRVVEPIFTEVFPQQIITTIYK